MSKETSKEFVEAVKASDDEKVKHAFYANLYEKVSQKIEAKRLEIAKKIFK